ncbi:kinesin-related protein13 [Zea mays]|uniref:Kinesin-related protein13 n=4 Tax=Zea mays TaxID=4577 RepID=A0A1D6KWE8_MAIZE|nr:kinesin-related protein13 [Zea mays]ONM06796.1 kinesin-related protein13 [Zea mays]|eukprot:NP_001295388.1 kinesin-related protein13 [Zea mays]
MEMVRRNLKRQASRSLSAFAGAASPHAVDQENLHPNLASTPPASPAKGTSSPRPKHPAAAAAAAAQPAATAEEDHSTAPTTAPADDERFVKVVVRVRPTVSRPVNGKDLWFVRKTAPDSVAVGDRSFPVDGVLDDRASQADAFDLVGLPMIENAMAGFNTSLVCYGQSGTGKTYTMWGPLGAMVDSGSDHADRGVVPRVFQNLFSRIQRMGESSPEKQTSYQCRCSFLEVHNEQINDLLEPSQRDLQIRENASNGIHVENLTDEYVSTADDISQILMKGLSNRKVGTTSMNLKSSRSHVIFTCVIEAWSKGSSNGFSSSRTSRITFVDLAGPDTDELGAAKHSTKEERHLKKSLSRLGKLVNVLSETPESHKVDLPYEQSRLTHVLKDTLGGNSRVIFLCSISSEHRCRSGTLSTLRFGERAKLMPNKPVINEISEDDVNGLSDQIRQLKDELIRTKSGDTTTCKARYFSAQSARESLHTLRVSLNRSLIFPHIEVDSEEEMDVDEEDVQELRDQISKIHSSSEDTLDDFMDAESGDESTPCSVGRSEDDQVIIDDFEGPQQEEQKEVSNNTNANEDLGSDRKSNLSIIASTRLSPIQDPTLCSSPKIHNKARMSITSLGLSPSKIRISDSPGDRNVEMCTNSAFRSSLQSSKLSPTDSLAASLQRGLHIIEYHQQNPAPRKSFIGLSFDHFARQSVAKISSAVQALPEDQGNNLCSFCKKPMNTNDNQTENVNLDKQIKDGNITKEIASKRETELEALCEEQRAKIQELSSLIDQYKNRSEELTSEGKVSVSLSVNEREVLLAEIQSLREQLKNQTTVSTTGSLLDQLRNGSTDQEYELDKERQKWMESESKWISLTEELRVDLESNRMHAEKTEMELCNEKKCTAELDDALQRAMYGHARMVEHYVELQELYNDLLEKHRRVMEAISEVKRAAARAGRKGCGTAFAAALAAELSTVRIDREKERAQLKEQNRRLRIQLRDTAEAVHAAGELLVRLRETEEASTLEKERTAALLQENEKLKKQLEKLRKKHEMELETMKVHLAESRLPESALGAFYHHENERTPDDDLSWRAAFASAYSD